MKVIDLPDSQPILTGGSPKGYRVSEWMDVNCTSPNSRPPAQLKWYINNEMVILGILFNVKLLHVNCSISNRGRELHILATKMALIW